jgi:hypothetical protein
LHAQSAPVLQNPETSWPQVLPVQANPDGQSQAIWQAPKVHWP